MATVSAFHSGKAIMKDAAVKEPVDYLPDIWPKEPVLLGESLIIDLFQFLGVVFNTLIIGRFLRSPGPINSRCVGHGMISEQEMQLYPPAITVN